MYTVHVVSMHIHIQFIVLHVDMKTSAEMNMEIFVHYFGIRMYTYFLVIAETKHVQLLRKLNGGGEVSCFVLLVF